MNRLTYHRKQGRKQVLACGAAAHGSSNCGLAGVPYLVFEQSLLSLNGAAILQALSGEQRPSPLDELKAKLAGCKPSAMAG